MTVEALAEMVLVTLIVMLVVVIFLIMTEAGVIISFLNTINITLQQHIVQFIQKIDNV
jgi:hypothetical protein